MRKLDDLFRELGLNENSSIGAREAFIKNLIRAAYGVEVQTPSEKLRKQTFVTESETQPKQLSFAINDLVAVDSKIDERKRRAR